MPEETLTLNSALYGFGSDQEYHRVQATPQDTWRLPIGIGECWRAGGQLQYQSPVINFSVSIWLPVLTPVLQ